MRLQQLRGRPILHFAWGRVCGWIADLAIDPSEGRVVALEVRTADDGQVHWFEPFPVWWSARHTWLLESEPETWSPTEPRPEWITLDTLPRLVVAREDGRAQPVVDADCDVRTWEITAYLRPSPWWWPARLHRLSPERVGVAIGDRPVTNEVSDQPGLAHGDA